MFDYYGESVTKPDQNTIETKYLSYSCSCVRFFTSPQVEDCSIVVTGSWMDEINRISLWQYDIGFKIDERNIEPRSEFEDGTCIGVLGDNKDEPRLISSLTHDGDVLSLLVNHEKELVFSSSSNGTINIYNVDNFHLKRTLDKPFQPNQKDAVSIGSLSISNDVQNIFMGDDFGNLYQGKIENLALTQRIGKTISGINAIQNLDSNTIACVTQSGVLYVYDTREKGTKATRYKTFRPNSCSPLLCIAQHPGYPYLLAVGGYSDNSVPAYIWDLRDDTSAPTPPLAELAIPGSAVWDIKFNPIQPNQLFVGTHDEGLMCISPEGQTNDGIVWCNMHSKRPRLGISSGIQNFKVKNCHSFDMSNSKLVSVSDYGLMITSNQSCSIY